MAKTKRKAAQFLAEPFFLLVLFPGGLQRAIPQQTLPQVVLRLNYLKAGGQEASLSAGRPAVTSPSTARAPPLKLG